MRVTLRKKGRGLSLCIVLLAISWWAAGCENTVTETQVVNEAQGSLSVSVAQQNECFESCVDGGEDAQDCREACYEPTEAGENACYEGCLERGESAEDCRMWCAEAIRPDSAEATEEGQNEEVLMCIRECMEDGGNEEECRLECQPLEEDVEG